MIDLDAIEARATEAAVARGTAVWTLSSRHAVAVEAFKASAADVPRLIAEVRRLAVRER